MSLRGVTGCMKIDEFCIKNDEFCIKNDGLCIQNDDLNANIKTVQQKDGVLQLAQSDIVYHRGMLGKSNQYVTRMQ